MSGTIVDKRTESERADTIGFVVATDAFMSGWGPCEGGRSLYAIPYPSEEIGYLVLEAMRNRSEMKRVRVVGRNYRPKLRAEDHLKITDFEIALGFIERWCVPETVSRYHDDIERLRKIVAEVEEESTP